jgi:tetratricopeptide (TPR) repeat protein
LAPEETALVVNAESWLSRSLANEYASLRGIPSVNLIQIEGIPSHEGIPVDQFRELILGPVLRTIEGRRLAPHIACIVYSADFPVWVDVSADIGRRRLPEVIGSRASLTGLTCLYQGVLARNLDYLDLNSNWYARRLRRGAPIGRVWTDEETAAYREVEAFFAEKHKRESQSQTQADLAAWAAEGWTNALERLRKVADAHPENAPVVYNLACALAQTGRIEEAMAALDDAADAGFMDFRHMQKDPDLVPLRGRAEFAALIERLREWQPDMMPPAPFSPAVGWTPQGIPAPPYKGARYLLSALLAVGSGRGNSYDEMLAALRRSVAADGTRPAGTIYFMLNEDVRSTCREWAVRGAAAQVRGHGVAAEVLSGTLPQGRTDVAGTLVGAASFDWKASASTILPGAICEHLTSFGAVFEGNSGQTPLTEFIRHGAAGASGTVSEPRAIQAKFPHAYLHAYYTAGYTLAEAFYLSVTGPYQLLVVGDALCAPWAQRPTLTITGLAPGQAAQGIVPLRLEAAEGGPALTDVVWFVGGQPLAMLPAERPAELDCSKLTPGWHQVSAVVGIAGPAQGRGHAVLPFYAGGQLADFEQIAVSPATVRWGGMLTVSRKGAAGLRLGLLWQAEEVAVLEPGESELKIPADRLALGEVTLRPVLGFGATALFGTPVTITIERPEPVGTLPAGLLSVLPEGLAVSVRETTTYAQRAEGDWLEKAGVAEGLPTTIETWFETAEPAFAQFQFRGNLPLDTPVLVDGVPFTVPTGSGWRSFPVALKVGTHTLRVATSGRNSPRLDIRYGQRGTAILDGKEFRHR